MTQDEIMDMVLKAHNPPTTTRWWDMDVIALEAFAKLVAQREREECAKVCDDINAKYKWPEDTAERVASQWCADAIRARGQA